MKNQTACIVIPGPIAPEDEPVLWNAVQRLRAALPEPVSIVRGWDPSAFGGKFDLVIRLSLGQAPDGGAGGPESFRIWTESASPLVLCVVAGDIRGLLYGAYRLADLIREASSGQDLSRVDLSSRPRVARRVALLGCRTKFGEIFRPGRYDESVAELPALGLNGVLIVPDPYHGTPAGSNLPIQLIGERYTIQEFEAEELSMVLRRLNSFGLDTYLAIGPRIPPNYKPEHVREYYQGHRQLPGYEADLARSFAHYLTVLFDRFPQVKGVVFYTHEGCEESAQSVTVFPCKDVAVGERVLETYLRTLAQTCQPRGLTACFWTHVYEITLQTMPLLREIVAGIPGLINLEDAYWNNCGWPYLPVLGYLPEALRNDIHRRSRFGLFMVDSDAENYFTGMLPSAYPDPDVRAAREAVARQADIVMLRLDEHDETGRGTLFSINGIIPEAAAQTLWEPTASLDELWQRWSRRQYGPKAAPAVVKALQHSDVILKNGFSCNGIPLMIHDGPIPYHWNPGSIVYRLFAKPGTPIVPKDQEPFGLEFMADQMHSRSLTMSEFRANLNQARAAAEQALLDLLPAKPHLPAGEYEYLRHCFADTPAVLDAMEALGQAAYALNLCSDNFDRHPDPHALLAQSLHHLHSLADQIEQAKGPRFVTPHTQIEYNGKTYLRPSLSICMHVIAEDYRKHALTLPTPSASAANATSSAMPTN